MKTLCTYLDNILNNPQEEKFRKIRKSNRAFSEKVGSVEGTAEFLEAVGFESQTMDEQVLVLP